MPVLMGLPSFRASLAPVALIPTPVFPQPWVALLHFEVGQGTQGAVLFDEDWVKPCSMIATVSVSAVSECQEQFLPIRDIKVKHMNALPCNDWALVEVYAFVFFLAEVPLWVADPLLEG